jgi:hypothetical protein
MHRTERAAIAMLLAAVTAAGCTRAQARTAPEMPALVVPAPPPRLVEPVTDLASSDEVTPAVAENDVATAPAPVAVAPRPATSTAGGVRTATSAITEPPAAVTPPPPAVLQTIPVVRETAVVRAIRADLDAAGADLRRVDYRQLSANARANYDQAQRFISQAEAALRERNFVFAETVADKAATLAAQVAGR